MRPTIAAEGFNLLSTFVRTLLSNYSYPYSHHSDRSLFRCMTGVLFTAISPHGTSSLAARSSSRPFLLRPVSHGSHRTGRPPHPPWQRHVARYMPRCTSRVARRVMLPTMCHASPSSAVLHVALCRTRGSATGPVVASHMRRVPSGPRRWLRLCRFVCTGGARGRTW
jgi:hypothetical protein